MLANFPPGRGTPLARHLSDGERIAVRPSGGMGGHGETGEDTHVERRVQSVQVLGLGKMNDGVNMERGLAGPADEIVTSW